MSRTDWPKACTIAKAAELFTAFGYPINRANLSRWISSRRFKGTMVGKRPHYDPNALFDVWMPDLTRRTMAGRTGGAASGPSQATQAPPAPPQPARVEPLDDPKRDLVRIQAQQARIALERGLGKTMSAEEVAAGLAEALANLRAAGAQKARDEAQKLLAELKLPGHQLGVVVAGLKRFAAHMQEAWAASASELLEASSTPGTPARERLDALTAYDLELRAEDAAEQAAPELETADP